MPSGEQTWNKLIQFHEEVSCVKRSSCVKEHFNVMCFAVWLLKNGFCGGLRIHS